MEEVPDAEDQKGNRYYRRRLLNRTFLQNDLMKLVFELPKQTSLKSLGFDIGLGDFVRIRPYTEEHKALVENPGGGRAYSPVLAPDTKGMFGLIVKAYENGGVSSVLKHASIGTELLVTNHVEHVFWKERQKGYFANDRNIEVLNGLNASRGHANDDVACEMHVNPQYNICLIAFGIGITEVAPVAMSELHDPCVRSVTILWATKFWRDVEWVWKHTQTDLPGDLLHEFFDQQKIGAYGDRLRIKHILSQETCEDCLRGRITPQIIKTAFSLDQVPKESLRFLAVGTTAMIAFTYEMLGQLGLDVTQKDSWVGANLLYRKLSEASPISARIASPLVKSAQISSCEPPNTDEQIEPPSKRTKI